MLNTSLEKRLDYWSNSDPVGIEPVSSAWKAEVLPLHNTRVVQTNHCPRGWWCREHAFIMAIRLPEASA